MTKPTITTPPTAPNRSAPTNFSSRMDAFLSWLVTFKPELDTAIDWFDTTATAVDSDAASAASSASAASASETAAKGAANYKGDYDASTTYAVGESVTYNGSEYVAKTENTGVTPVDGANWLRVVAIKTRWSTKTAAYTAVVGDRILADTSAGIFTVTLPASPTSGDEVWFADPDSNWATNNLTVDGNGKNIDGAASFTADVNEGHFIATYNATAWVVRFTGGTA